MLSSCLAKFSLFCFAFLMISIIYILPYLICKSKKHIDFHCLAYADFIPLFFRHKNYNLQINIRHQLEKLFS